MTAIGDRASSRTRYMTIHRYYSCTTCLDWDAKIKCQNNAHPQYSEDAQKNQMLLSTSVQACILTGIGRIDCPRSLGKILTLASCSGHVVNKLVAGSGPGAASCPAWAVSMGCGRSAAGSLAASSPSTSRCSSPGMARKTSGSMPVPCVRLWR